MVVTKDSLTAAEVYGATGRGNRVVLSELLWPTAAHLRPSYCRWLDIHLGIDVVCRWRAATPRTSEGVVAVDVILLTVDDTVAEDVAILDSLGRNSQITTLLTHHELTLIEEDVALAAEEVGATTQHATLEVVETVVVV